MTHLAPAPTNQERLPSQTVIPIAARTAAYLLLHDIMGAKEVGEMSRSHPATIAHMVRVGGMMINLMQMDGRSPEMVKRAGIMGVCHDIGKRFMQIPDHGVLSDAERRHVREEHTRLGFEWAHVRFAETDNFDLIFAGFAARYHHSPIASSYASENETTADAWGLVHMLKVCDITDALLTRPYVAEREGAMTPEKAIGVALGAAPPLPGVYLEGQVLPIGSYLHIMHSVDAAWHS